MAHQAAAALRDRGRAQDAAHAARLAEIIDEHGWPGTSLVGEKGRNGAFMVLQHSDPETQKRYLTALRDATANGEMPTTALPLLEDRILVRDGKPQIYGTQITRGPDGAPTPWQIADEEHVDERRAAVGLEPLATYLERFRPPSS